MKLAEKSFFIFIILKQFYIFKSGGLQLGDIFLMITLGILFYTKQLYLDEKDKIMGIFIFLVWIINIFWMIEYDDNQFFISSLHYLFNYFVIIIFRVMIKERRFLEKMLMILKLNLIIQTCIYFFGYGKYYAETRYMGTFNDPNQMAFFVFISFMMILIISDLIKQKINIGIYLISLFLIIETMSTGMMMGYIIVVIGWNVMKINSKKILKINVKKLALIVVGIGLFSIWGKEIEVVMYEKTNIDSLITRIEEKFGKIKVDENEMSLIEERGIDRVIKYPLFNIIGAGQGGVVRFPRSFHMGEIHSTFPSILFSYGILGLGLVIGWIYRNIKNIPIYVYGIFLALIIESFTLLNQRQPLFWMIFMLGSLYGGGKKYDISNNASIQCREIHRRSSQKYIKPDL